MCRVMHRAPVLRRIQPLRTLRVQNSNHHISRTGIKVCSSQYAATRQDADVGEGYQDFRSPVHYQRSCCPDLGLYTSRFEPLSNLSNPSSKPRSSATETSTTAWRALERWGSGPKEEFGASRLSGQGCVQGVSKAPRESLFPLPNSLIRTVTSLLGVVCRISKPHS
jgi:hypothetical protein